MTTIASQITRLTVVYSTVHLDADQGKHQSSASLAFVWGIHRDRWIPHTKGQLRGKCFHLITSSCTVLPSRLKNLISKRFEHYNTWPHRSGSLWHIAARRLEGYWNINSVLLGKRGCGFTYINFKQSLVGRAAHGCCVMRVVVAVAPSLGTGWSWSWSKTYLVLVAVVFRLLVLSENNSLLYTLYSLYTRIHLGHAVGSLCGCHTRCMSWFGTCSWSCSSLEAFLIWLWRCCWLEALWVFSYTVETLYNTINFCWSTHKRHSIARPKGRGMGCLLWVQRATYCVDLSYWAL